MGVARVFHAILTVALKVLRGSWKRSALGLISLGIGVFGVVVMFQNCARVGFDPQMEAQFSSLAVCEFDGKAVEEGGSVTAYLESSAPFDQACQQEERTCRQGVLSGRFSYASCQVNAPASCLFNGKTIPHGQTFHAYFESSVSFNQTCLTEERSCTNGILSGSFQFSNCQINKPRSCQFNGKVIEHGKSIVAFLDSTVPFSKTCNPQNRTCSNGVLSGSYRFGSCSVNKPASCLFNGQTIVHRQSVNAFLNSQVSYGGVCVPEKRTCNNGILSGISQFGSCSVNKPASCLFNGQTIVHGQSVNAFLKSSVPFNGDCKKELRKCSNGSLSGAYSFASCSKAQPASCLFNGETISHGQGVTAYISSNVPFGVRCMSETRLCTDGDLSGTFEFDSCEVNMPASCIFDGRTIAHNQKVTAFQTSRVPFGNTCKSESRLCQNGQLTGDMMFSSCAIDRPASCLFNGRTLAHEGTVKAFQSSAVAFGKSCAFETRTCFDGVLSGSFGNLSCKVSPGKNCQDSITGEVIKSGSSVEYYESFLIAASGTCKSQTRVCTNGVLSGQYLWKTCEKLPPVDCTSQEGVTIAHGQQTTMFRKNEVQNGQKCEPQEVSCKDGKLSGSYRFSRCTVLTPQESCTAKDSSHIARFVEKDVSDYCDCTNPTEIRPSSNLRCAYYRGVISEKEKKVNRCEQVPTVSLEKASFLPSGNAYECNGKYSSFFGRPRTEYNYQQKICKTFSKDVQEENGPASYGIVDRSGFSLGFSLDSLGSDKYCYCPLGYTSHGNRGIFFDCQDGANDGGGGASE